MLTRKKRIASALLLAAVGLAAAVPYLVPLSPFIPGLEAAVASRLHEPVKIGGLRLFVLPLPRIVARDITVGQPPLLRIDTLSARPSMLSLLSQNRVISEVRLEGVRARQPLFKRIAGWVKDARAANGDSKRAFRVGHITLRDGEILFDKFTLKTLNGEARFSEGRPIEITGSQDDGRLRVVARPDTPESWKLDIEARNWSVPVGLPAHFDYLETVALVSATGLASKNVAASLYGGTLSGPLSVGWTQGWAVDGEWELQNVDIGPLAALLKRDIVVSGQLSGHPTFTLTAMEPSKLIDGLRMESDFSVKDASIQKVDLVAAAKNPLNRDAGRGGKTEFKQLSGHLSIDEAGYDLSDLEASSGLLKATGDVSVTRAQKLTGRIDVDLIGTASLVSIPLELGGTPQDISVFPSRAAMAGAVAGSVLLPGIGTAVGIKASQLTERLFGHRKPVKKPEAAAPPSGPSPPPGRQ
jgi:uncharacterized protein involved in outer membrane biogenesis